MKKAGSWLKLWGGAASSTLGAIGAALLIVCPCKVAALSAIMIAVFGVGAASMIKKYSWILIAAGLILLGWGVYSLLKSRKKECTCCKSEE